MTSPGTPLPAWAAALLGAPLTEEARAFLLGPEAVVGDRTIAEWVAACRHHEGGSEAQALVETLGPLALPALAAAIAAIQIEDPDPRGAASFVHALERIAEQEELALVVLAGACRKAQAIHAHWHEQVTTWTASYESFMGGVPDKEPPDSGSLDCARAFDAACTEALDRVLELHRREDGTPLLLDEVEIRVRDGEITDGDSWIYVWVRPKEDAEVVYVGATGVPPVVRTWLHLHDERPRAGRVRATRPDVLSGDVTVRAFRIEPTLDRQAVKQVVIDLLDGKPGTDDGVSTSCRQAAAAIVARL